MIGLSWLAVERISSFPSAFTTSQAQPEPKRVAAAAEKASLKASNEPKVASISANNLEIGTLIADAMEKVSKFYILEPFLLSSL